VQSWVDRNAKDSLQKADDLITDGVTSIVAHPQRALASQIDGGAPTMLVSRSTVMGATASSLKRLVLEQEVIVYLSLVADHISNYVPLGHIPEHQALNDNPTVV
jgi:DNA repair exonuclease SbcCD nuclease subunit